METKTLNRREKREEDKSFKKFIAICQVIGFIFLLIAIFVYSFGIPNFSDFDEQREFCRNNSGIPIEPSRETYNNMLCIFSYDLNTTTRHGKWMSVGINKIDKEWANAMGREVGDYCFSCWDESDCLSSYNDVLREKGVHC